MSSSQGLLAAALASTKPNTTELSETQPIKRVGVTFHRQREKWQASISVKGKDKHLGLHVRFEDAVRAREKAEIKYGYRIIK